MLLVEEVVINDGDAQRSMITEVNVRFNAVVTLGASAFALVNRDTGMSIGTSLTTNVVGCAPEAVHIGMPVKVTFRRRSDEVALPVFEPDPAPRPPHTKQTRPARARPSGWRQARGPPGGVRGWKAART